MAERRTGLKEPQELARLKKLSEEDLHAFSDTYRQGLLGGLPMRPSYLAPITLDALPRGRKALVIEVGGTNAYGARITVEHGKDGAGVPVVESSGQEPLGRTTFDSMTDFFDTIITKLPSVLFKESRFDALAIVYSFDGQAERTDYGVDVRSPEKLAKGFVIPGIGGKLVGEEFVMYLAKRLGTRADIPIAVLNDTVAVALAGGSAIGAVIGSGFNLAVSVDQNLINTESGSFRDVPQHPLAEYVDGRSTNKGEHLAEKQVSGLYLGEQYMRVLELLGQRPDFPQSEAGIRLSQAIADEAHPAHEYAKALRERSAQLSGTMIGTAIDTFADQFGAESVSIPIEGSLFWKMPGYENMVRDYVGKIVEKKIEFKKIPNAGRVGAGVAALSLLDRV